MSKQSKAARDNRANQLNPQHSAYHQSRGVTGPSLEKRLEEHRQVPDLGPVNPKSKDDSEKG